MGEVSIFSEAEVRQATLEYFNGDELAANVWVEKYALRDNDGNFLEKTPDDMFRNRLAPEFARIEKKYPNPMSEEEIYDLLKDFRDIILQGSPMSAVGNHFQVQSTGNCFTIASPYDSYAGICKTDQESAQLYKRRAGVGFDISTLRPKGMATNNAARTTDGIAVFMERFSNTCREVAHRGRRGASIQTLSVKHPEVETFIDIKQDKKKVTGSNISLRISDEFMKAVLADDHFTLQWPVDTEPKITAVKKAKEIWSKFIDANWASAEPGVQFEDTIHRYSPAHVYAKKDPRFYDRTSNPCLTADMTISTPVGSKPISSLIGQQFQAVVGTNSYSSTTEGFFCTGKQKKVFLLVLKSGYRLKCTHNHQILTKRGWVRADKLTSHDQVICSDFKGGFEVSSFVSLEYLGKEDVYDATIPEIGMFVANGIVVHNCGELNMGQDSCRLILVNLYSFVKDKFAKNAFFDFNRFGDIVVKAQRLMDDLVDIELEHIDAIIAKVKSDPEPEDVKQTELKLWENFKETCALGRRTGLGITGLGDALAAMGIRYGSKEAIEATDNIYRKLAVGAYKSTCILAKERGPFPLFDRDIENGHPFLQRIWDAAPDVFKLYKKYGRRNVALTTTAPAGSVSLLTQTTSGIEPAFALKYKRYRKVDKDAGNIDRVDAVGDAWQAYDVYHHGFKEWMEVSGETEIEKSPYYKATSNDIDWLASVEILSKAQYWTCHSISKTCNVPKDTPKELVSEMYIKAWQSGCKGFTIYRDGCRDGVLVAEGAPKPQTEAFPQHSAPKRPKELPCDIHHTMIAGEPWVVLIGAMEGKPYELFGGKSDLIEIPKKYEHGILVKNPRKTTNSIYDLKFGENGDEVIVKDINKVFDNPNHSSLTRMISLAIRHGASIKYAVEQLQKDKTSDLFAFSRCIARVLKTYIKENEEVSGERCPECGSKLIYSEGCKKCANENGKVCSFAKCG